MADFTYVATWSGIVYVAFAIDAFSRRIVGWKADSSMKTPLVLDKLEMALWAFVAALSRAPYDQHLRAVLAASYRGTRADLASFLGLGKGEISQLQAGVLIAIFDGLLIQWLVDPDQARQDITVLPGLLDTWVRLPLEHTPQTRPSA